jgi:uncharacterized protein involved in exopolysaccharide biosynthesis
MINELKAGIAELRQRIQVESRNVMASTGINAQISHQREAQVRASLEAQRTKVLQLKATRDEAQLMVKDVESAQRAYDTIQARFSQTSLESQSNQTNVSPLKVAMPPVSHSSPRPVLYMIQAIFVGLFVGIGLSLLVELQRRRIRDNSEIHDLVGVELLGSIPEARIAQGGALPIRFTPKLPSRALLQLPSPANK